MTALFIEHTDEAWIFTLHMYLRGPEYLSYLYTLLIYLGCPEYTWIYTLQMYLNNLNIYLTCVPWSVLKFGTYCPKIHELYLRQIFSRGFQVQNGYLFTLFTLFTLNQNKCNKGSQVPNTFCWCWTREQHFWIIMSGLCISPTHKIYPCIINSELCFIRLRATALHIEETDKLILFNDISHVNLDHTMCKNMWIWHDETAIQPNKPLWEKLLGVVNFMKWWLEK